MNAQRSDVLETSPSPAASRRAGLGTRAELHGALADGIASVPDGRALLLLALDVDDFRRYNADYGYEAGDAFLDAFAQRLAGMGGRAFALGADAFALVFEGTPVELWRHGAAALWTLDPGAGGPGLRCSFGAAIVTDRGTDAAACLALAEDRLADQRNRVPSVAERYGELILAILRAQQPETSAHAFDVAYLAARVAARLGVDPLERGLVWRAAELHDVGKIAVDPAIIRKPGPLDEDEWAHIRRHTILGDELLLAAPPLRAVAALVRASHERWDGQGYPDGVAGEDIPLAARIVAACDAYDAMTTDRVYRRGMSAAAARAELEACAGTQFDPAVVAALIAELMEPHRLNPMAAAVSSAAHHAQPGEAGTLAAFARLHSQLDAASLIESPDELPRALQTVAAAVAETLGFHDVVVNLYRKAWDDFIVSTVHGDESLRAALLGCTYSWQDWESMLSERFRHGDAYLVYDGELDWDQQSGKRIVADASYVVSAEGPDAWQVEDEIFVPFHHADGSVLGILNVGSPASGRRPCDEDLEMLSLVVRHAARAVRRAQDAANAAAHRRGLEELLRVSSQLTETVSAAGVLQAICSGISQGLGFGRVLVQLRREDSDVLASVAGVGIGIDDLARRFVLHDSELDQLLDPAFETQGCYLLPLDEGKRRVPSYADTFPSECNGRGPAAWDRHWLVVPLIDRTGVRLGAVFADDPSDRLLPTRERLQALRLFANQATSALESSAQYETMRHLADRDPLTKLLNRRAFVRRLDEAAERGRRSGQPLSLVYCDLDSFKAVNDTRGHADGDRVLRSFSEVLLGAVRHDDAVFRMGGDEFALLLERCPRERALEVVDRVLERLREQGRAGDLPVGASFGVAVADCSGPVDSDELLRRADDAMYDAKGSRATLCVAA
jgi:diguanylate cyclase (GGDEF)-like protein